MLGQGARRHIALVLGSASLLTIAGSLWRDRGASGAPSSSTRAAIVPAKSRTLAVEALAAARLDGVGYVADADDGARAELTLDPRLERVAAEALAKQDAPLGAIVMVDVRDGRVLALAGRDQARPTESARSLALAPWAPAASVFKVVTASALVDAGVSPQARVCYHEGIHSVEASNLVAHPALDTSCQDLAFGVAKSQNAILARLAHDFLDGATLDRTARALGFGAALPFDAPLAPSALAIPPDAQPLEQARAAAGFWHTTLSPLHGAYLAATIARGGTTPPLHVVERFTTAGGAETVVPAASRRVLDEETAAAVGKMMVGTTEYGTAKSGFHDRRGRSLLGGVRVAGKTGSLFGYQGADGTPSRERQDPSQKMVAYSWFVGYAPADDPQVAVAVLLGNDMPWRTRAHVLAEKMLAAHLGTRQPLVATR